MGGTTRPIRPHPSRRLPCRGRTRPYDKALSTLIGELSTRSEDFRTRWAAHDAHIHNTGVEHFRHPLVGELALTYEKLDLAAGHGLSILIYTAEPDSPSREALDMLASWTAEPNQSTARSVTKQS